MKKLLILIAAALFLSACAQSTAEIGVTDGETLNYTTDIPTESASQVEHESDSEAESRTDAEASESDNNSGTESTEISPESTAPAQTHISGITLTVYELWLSVGESFMPIVTMAPENAADKSELWSSSDTSVATVDPYGNICAVGVGDCTVTVTSKDNPDVSAEVKVHASVAETAPSQPDEPPAAEGVTYINGILVVNKTYALPPDYNPGVDPEAQEALYTMFADAADEGLSLWVKSGVRTYADQKWQYNVYVERDGKALADTYSARPGHSEHQTGLAFDLNSLYKSFGDTAEGKWLAANCHRYGFIIRYPEGKEHITGYMYEPWHVRYVGAEHAAALHESGLCLEEYLGITSQYDY